MKGYITSFGYLVYINGRKMLFPTEEEYREYIREENTSYNEQ